MSADVERDFPLFPLGLVALPGELIPLHIFEERFKTMMNECIEAEREFGIVWLSDDGLKTIGCAARIETVAPDDFASITLRQMAAGAFSRPPFQVPRGP